MFKNHARFLKDSQYDSLQDRARYFQWGSKFIVCCVCNTAKCCILVSMVGVKTLHGCQPGLCTCATGDYVPGYDISITTMLVEIFVNTAASC